MNLKITKVAAALTLVIAATFSLPLAANAGTYPANDAATVTPATAAPGQTVTFSVEDGTFVPGEPVTVTITGANANAAALASVAAGQQTKTLGTWPANADGGLDPVVVRLPSNASGRYTFTATSPSLPAGVSAIATIVVPGGGSLPATGMDSASLLGLWVGGGALVLAGGAVAVGAAVHRQRKHADA